ncbi:MAG TPA: TSUP family transporter [Bacteroidota bacterium]|nr:TSUP family transporter [Bacteroidota bacterium]
MVESFWLYPLLFCTAGIAGLVDSIAGGGGLITLPVLLAVGIPPKFALGTNKFQSSFGSFTAAIYFVRHGVAGLKEIKTGVIFTLVGAAVGAWTVQQINSTVLNQIIPFFLLAILLYTFVVPKFGEFDGAPKFSRNIFFIVAGLVFGFYDGFFGPGVGSFWAMAIVFGLGVNLTKATGTTKVLNFTSNIVSFALFLAGGYVIFFAGMTMAVGQIVGARFGSRMVVKKGSSFIRPVYVAVVVATTAKLLYNAYIR